MGGCSTLNLRHHRIRSSEVDPSCDVRDARGCRLPAGFHVSHNVASGTAHSPGRNVGASRPSSSSCAAGKRSPPHPSPCRRWMRAPHPPRADPCRASRPGAPWMATSRLDQPCGQIGIQGRDEAHHQASLPAERQYHGRPYRIGGFLAREGRRRRCRQLAGVATRGVSAGHGDGIHSQPQLNPGRSGIGQFLLFCHQGCSEFLPAALHPGSACR